MQIVNTYKVTKERTVALDSERYCSRLELASVDDPHDHAVTIDPFVVKEVNSGHSFGHQRGSLEHLD